MTHDKANPDGSFDGPGPFRKRVQEAHEANSDETATFTWAGFEAPGSPSRWLGPASAVATTICLPVVLTMMAMDAPTHWVWAVAGTGVVVWLISEAWWQWGRTTWAVHSAPCARCGARQVRSRPGRGLVGLRDNKAWLAELAPASWTCSDCSR